MAKIKQDIFQSVLGITLIAAIIPFLPFNSIKTNQLADNPDNCPYYITLQSVLADYVLLANDQANLQFIKQKILNFENDLNRSTKPDALVSPYRDQFYKKLSQWDIKTIKTVSRSDLILSIANVTYTIIDNYYLDNNLYCRNPLYNGNTAHTLKRIPERHSKRIPQFNLSAIYEHIPNRYSRILGAAPDDFQFGAFSGFFVNNKTTILNTQFTTASPMLTALYVMPHHNFENIGTYKAIVPWNIYSSDHFTNPVKRRLYDIAGIDILTLETTDPDINAVRNVIPIPSHVNTTFSLSTELKTFINSQSYGMAYLANQINYLAPEDIKPFESEIHKFFSSLSRNKQNYTRYRAATDVLHLKLMDLKHKHDIVLESKQSKLTTPLNKQSPGIALVKGIIGERAFIETDCQREQCTLVVNIANNLGWHAFVNKKPADIERANFAFMATSVPQGNSGVWFIYQPFTALASYLLSLLSFIGILLASLASPNIFSRNKKV